MKSIFYILMSKESTSTTLVPTHNNNHYFAYLNKCVLLINVNYDFQVLNVLIFTTFTIILYIWYVSFCCFQIVAVLLMASVFATLEMRLQMSWRTRFMKLIVLAFIISIPMTWFELYKVKNQHLRLWYLSNFVSNSNLTCALHSHSHYYSVKPGVIY